MAISVNSEDHVQGRTDARIVLVEYGDFQCPYCKKAYYIVKKIQEELGADLKYVFRNFPLSDLHPDAYHAAVAAETAAAQNKFWDMHDILFENQEYLDDTYLMQYAKIVGLDIDKFEKDFGNDRIVTKVENDYDSGEENGVEGTPTFFVNGKLFEGDWRGTEFIEYLKSLI